MINNTTLDGEHLELFLVRHAWDVTFLANAGPLPALVGNASLLLTTPTTRAAVRVDTESDTVADRARLEQIRAQVKVEQKKLAGRIHLNHTVFTVF